VQKETAKSLSLLDFTFPIYGLVREYLS
jgi:hypothetical protein